MLTIECGRLYSPIDLFDAKISFVPFLFFVQFYLNIKEQCIYKFH